MEIFCQGTTIKRIYMILEILVNNDICKISEIFIKMWLSDEKDQKETTGLWRSNFMLLLYMTGAKIVKSFMILQDFTGIND